MISRIVGFGKRRSVLLVISFALGVSLVFAGSASGAIIPRVDSMYPTMNYHPSCVDGTIGSTYCQTDNAAVSFGMESMTAAQKLVFRNVMSSQFNPTDLSTVENSTIVYTGSAETDIVYQVGNLGSGLNGITWCDDAVTSYQCDQHYVRIVASRVSSSVSTPCHESGHAVGLTHGQDAFPAVANDNTNLECMRTPGTNVATLGAHNVAQINGEY